VLYQLSYVSQLKLFVLERVVGIEPTSSAWKAEVLPLNYTRADAHPHPAEPLAFATVLASTSAIVVEGDGFEPSKA
jgi:hypothetical protein